MGAGLNFWALKPVEPEKVLLFLTQAAFRSRCKFFSDACEVREYKGTLHKVPPQFTIHQDVRKNTAMIFHFDNVEEQEECRYQWSKFYDRNGVFLNDNALCRLCVSEDIDAKMSFYFIYEYLNVNRDHVAHIGFYIDWPTMKEIYEEGYKEYWCWPKPLPTP